MPAQESDSLSQAPALDHTRRRVRLLAALGILLTSALIGGMATVLLYQSKATNLRSQVQFALELQSAAISAELERLRQTARQVTSRTRIRQELERFRDGEIDLASLVAFTEPKLADALDPGGGVVGITRIDPENDVLVQVGEPIHGDLRPRSLSPYEVTLGAPDGGRIVVAAPIRNRAGVTLGTDFVMFADDRLRAVMQGFFGDLQVRGGISVARLAGGALVRFYAAGDDMPALTPEVLKTELIRFTHLGAERDLHEPDAGGADNALIGYRSVAGSDWVLVYHADSTRFFQPARRHAAFAAATVAILALLGITLTSKAIRPLVNQVASEARSLQRLLRHNRELLAEVQAKEAKMQAIIDGAPAVIFVKDPDGRYLLVNSAYERLVHLPRDEIVGKFDYQLFPDDIAKSTRDTDLEVLATGRAITIDERAPHPDGMHDYLSTKFPLHDSTGERYAVCGISTDITERKRAERRLALTQSTVDQANIGVYWADPNGRMLYANAAALGELGFARLDLLGQPIDTVVPELEGAAWTMLWQRLEREGSAHFEMQQRRRNGSLFPAELHAIHLAHDEQEYFIAIVQNIAARLEAEQQIKQSATVFECTTEAIVITDNNGTVLDVNPAFTQMLGYTRDEVLGRRPSMWKSDRHGEAFYREMWQAIGNEGRWRGEIINRHKDGSLVPELVAINTVYDDDGHPASRIAVCTDIRQIRESQEKLAHLAHHDALTGLPNRLLYYERLQHGLDRAARRGGRVGVIFVDLDNFKDVNDSLGHSVGDRLLIEVSDLLRAALRNDDTVARIGGDEFTILIEDVQDRAGLIGVVEKIMATFDREFVLGNTRVRVSCSIGVSISPDDGDKADTLMRNADAAMYRAKSLGRNTYQFYTKELTRIAFERMHIDGALRKAIGSSEFQLYYQPQIELEHGRVVGMEALLRWESTKLGSISPDQFIPIAENNGLILPLGEWVLEEACSQARRWLDAGLLKGTVAVNISGVQVRRGDLARVVESALQRTGLPAERLELEVTESFVMGESSHAIEELGKLRAIGVTLAVDDFGTGYSSLAYLKSLPVQRLKIDKSFICDIPHDSNDVAITRAVIALGRSLNLELIGEGVETEIQRRFLIEEGCTTGQGYLFHRPLMARDMHRLLVEQQPLRAAN